MDTGSSFFGLSLSDTILKLMTSNEIKRALKLKSDFKVPDKRCL